MLPAAVDARPHHQAVPAFERSQEAQQRKCWQHFVQSELCMAERLSEGSALPPAVEGHLASLVQRYHSGMLNVEDAKQVTRQSNLICSDACYAAQAEAMPQPTSLTQWDVLRVAGIVGARRHPSCLASTALAVFPWQVPESTCTSA